MEKEKNTKKNQILIGHTLKNIRKSLGLTQEKVAEALNLAPRYISDIERDKTKGSLTTLIKLCNLYNVSPSFVLRDYIDAVDFKIDDTIVGYYNLSEKEKAIVRELIKFMNQKDNEL
mgnify:CR=1 FL=1